MPNPITAAEHAVEAVAEVPQHIKDFVAQQIAAVRAEYDNKLAETELKIKIGILALAEDGGAGRRKKQSMSKSARPRKRLKGVTARMGS